MAVVSCNSSKDSIDLADERKGSESANVVVVVVIEHEDAGATELIFFDPFRLHFNVDQVVVRDPLVTLGYVAAFTYKVIFKPSIIFSLANLKEMGDNYVYK